MTPVVQWVWQGSLLALSLALLLRLTPRLNAATRYMLWWTALVVTLLIPTFSADATLSLRTVHPLVADPATALTDVPALAAGGLLTVPALPDWLMAIIAGAWLGSVAVALARLARSVRYVGWLRTTSRPVPLAVERTLTHRQAVRAMARAADLRVSAAIDGACALGLAGRPTVVVSERLLQGLSPAALDLIVLHEQLHLSRYDDWARLLQSLVLAVLGWHPGVRLISAHLDFEREAACDAAAALFAGDARRYASSLADAADAMAGWTRPVAPLVVPNATGTGRLIARVQRLLDPAISRQARLQAPALAGLSAAIASLALALAHAGPLVTIAPASAASVASRAVAPAAPTTHERTVRSPGDANLQPLAIAARPKSASAASRRGRRATEGEAAPEVATPAPAAVAAASGADTGQVTAAAQAGEADGSARSEDDVLPARTLSPIAVTGAINHVPGALGETTPAPFMAGAAVGERLARVGTTAAASASRAGLTVGGFFSRAGKAIAARRF